MARAPEARSGKRELNAVTRSRDFSPQAAKRGWKEQKLLCAIRVQRVRCALKFLESVPAIQLFGNVDTHTHL